MPRVDFYLLDQHVPNGKFRAVCRLSQKIFALGQKTVILAVDTEQAKSLDDFMWTFQQDSFLPHYFQDPAGERTDTPILISCSTEDSANYDVLISLLDQVPEHFDRYQRVAEFVDENATEKERARDRYRHYREQGCDLQTHQIHP